MKGGAVMTWAEQQLVQREREQERWLNSRPVCDVCGEPIQDDYFYKPEDEIMCESCFNDYVSKYVVHEIE